MATVGGLTWLPRACRRRGGLPQINAGPLHMHHGHNMYPIWAPGLRRRGMACARVKAEARRCGQISGETYRTHRGHQFHSPGLHAGTMLSFVPLGRRAAWFRSWLKHVADSDRAVVPLAAASQMQLSSRLYQANFGVHKFGVHNFGVHNFDTKAGRSALGRPVLGGITIEFGRPTQAASGQVLCLTCFRLGLGSCDPDECQSVAQRGSTFQALFRSKCLTRQNRRPNLKGMDH